MNLAMPKALHEIFGRSQTPLALAAIAVAGVAVMGVWAPGILGQGDVALWRRVLALLLLLDIAAGAVANLTPGTNDFYAGSAKRRWTFILVHVHLPVFALLLETSWSGIVVVWAYTVGAAVVLNILWGHPYQRVLAGLSLAVGLGTLPFLVFEPVALAASALFVFKVCYAFAVDHRKVPAS